MISGHNIQKSARSHVIATTHASKRQFRCSNQEQDCYNQVKSLLTPFFYILHQLFFLILTRYFIRNVEKNEIFVNIFQPSRTFFLPSFNLFFFFSIFIGSNIFELCHSNGFIFTYGSCVIKINHYTQHKWICTPIIHITTYIVKQSKNR